MDRKKASREIVELFISAAGRYRSLDKIPVRTASKHDLYHSERHMLDKIGDNPGMNITDFAKALGVTKGAVSQVVKKLELKGVVTRLRRDTNEKEVLLELTEAGRAGYLKHKKTNEETLRPLLKELERYSDDKIEFLIDFFRWTDGFLAESGKKTKERH